MKEQILRRLFKACMKDKHLKNLARRHWPVMVTEVDGQLFHLHPADNTTEHHLFLQRRYAEQDSLDFLAGHMRGKSCLFIDIGANCGAYTVPLARAVGQGSRILAFEPSPVMMSRLKTNLEANGLLERVQTHQLALSSVSGSASLHVHAKNHGQSSLGRLDRSTHAITVAQHPLVRFVPQRPNAERFVIKIDVEGREDTVLYPFLEVAEPRQLPDIVLVEMVHEDQWRQDLRRLLGDLDYRISFEGDGNAAFERVRR